MRGRTHGDRLAPVRRLCEIGVIAAIALGTGCGARETSGLLEDTLADGGKRDGAFFDDDFDPNAPPPPDAGGLCGNEIIPTLIEPPNLYFVMDRSGSMGDIVEGQSKYTSLEIAVVDLVRQIGGRARIGAAVFPSFHPEDSCRPGVEVYPATIGDSLSYIDSGTDGPVTTGFASAIHLTPRGGTPTGSTLESLLPKLAALEGKTYVILATDGGPNCNPDTPCSTLTCIPNIEKLPGCTEARNCCTSETYGPLNCLDATRTTRAVEGLSAAGITTYVIGLPGAAGAPGTEIYAWLLDEMALAGGAAREGKPKYFAVNLMSELRDVLGTIGAEVIATCDYTLSEKPSERGKVNVYFDKKIVLRDSEDGWDWTGPASLSLRGKACDEVKSGSVGQVQIVVGCPTEEPR